MSSTSQSLFLALSQPFNIDFLRQQISITYACHTKKSSLSSVIAFFIEVCCKFLPATDYIQLFGVSIFVILVKLSRYFISHNLTHLFADRPTIEISCERYAPVWVNSGRESIPHVFFIFLPPFPSAGANSYRDDYAHINARCTFQAHRVAHFDVCRRLTRAIRSSCSQIEL